MNQRLRTRIVLALASFGLTTPFGCGVAPKAFSELGKNPAAINRARAVGLGQTRADDNVVPRLIERLDDTDPVVRLTAHEDLKRRTRQDFGFVPWAEAAERAPAAAQWKAWWQSSHGVVAEPTKTP